MIEPGGEVLGSIRRIIRLQMAVTVASALLWLVLSGKTAGIFAFAGGAVGFVSAIAYAAVIGLLAPPGAGPEAALRAHAVAQSAKFAATVVLFVAAFVVLGGEGALPLFVTYVATLVVYWVALLIKN